MDYFNNLPDDLIIKINMTNLCEEIESRCLNGVCMKKASGGRGFEIRGKMFCSPCCGNQHFNLKPYDYDFWFHYCDDCDDCLDYGEIDESESDSEYNSEEEDDEFKCVEC